MKSVRLSYFEKLCCIFEFYHTDLEIVDNHFKKLNKMKNIQVLFSFSTNLHNISKMTNFERLPILAHLMALLQIKQAN